MKTFRENIFFNYFQAWINLKISSFVEENSSFVLTNDSFMPNLAALNGIDTANLNTEKSPKRMWPVQTLTLLLCLTDEEQLFAQNQIVDPIVPAIEVAAPAADDTAAGALALFGDC